MCVFVHMRLFLKQRGVVSLCVALSDGDAACPMTISDKPCAMVDCLVGCLNRSLSDQVLHAK